MKHFYFLLICLCSLSFQAGIYAQSNVVDEIIWVVGDDAIYLSDVENMRLYMQMNGERYPGDPYCTIPEQLAIRKLFIHQAKLDSIEVSDADVYGYVERRIQMMINYSGSQEKLEENYNKSINAIREELRNETKEEIAVDRVKQSLMKNVKVTPTEVQRYYKRIPTDSLPFMPTTVEVEIITFEPKISLAEIDDIKKRLWDFTEQVTSGKEQFASLARRYSDDKETALNGGRTGFRGRAELLPEFAAAAFDLNDTRRVSRIVETEYGYHIIQLIEKRGDRIDVRHILLRPFVSKDEIDYAILQLDSLRSGIVDEKITFGQAAHYFSADKDTRNNKGLMVNTPNLNYQYQSINKGTSRFEMSELPPEIAKTVNTMAVGEISKPFSMINTKTNREIVAIVRLKSRIEQHKANLSDDFQAIRAKVEEQKKLEIHNNWIAKKQKETYIRINDNWKNCDFERDGWIQQ